MKPLFTPEDFKFVKNPETHLQALLNSDLHPSEAAKIANAKLARLIESWPVVYGKKDSENYALFPCHPEKPTHQARLAFIQPIESQYSEIKIDKQRFVEETKKLVDEAVSKAWKRLNQNTIHECKHEPTYECIFDQVVKIKCKHCGILLKAKWEAVK